MLGRRRLIFAYGLIYTGLLCWTGCAAMRGMHQSGSAAMYRWLCLHSDGWRLGVRHYQPDDPDTGKLPVILCHGLGLNATFGRSPKPTFPPS